MEPHRRMRKSICRGVMVLLFGGPLAVAASSRPAAADPKKANSGENARAETQWETPRKGADLGLSLSRAPGVLREQLSLDAGTGLVVDAVAAGSIAARAGIRRHDVLVSLDDLPITVPEQMTGLVEAPRAETPLRCRVFRGGSALTIPLPLRQPAGRSGGEIPTTSFSPAANHKPVQRGRVGLLVRVADETLLQQDADYHIKVTICGETRLFVRDSRGLTVYNGAIDTPEQRSLMPIAIRDRVERMERLLESPPSAGSLVPQLVAAPHGGNHGSARAGSDRPVPRDSAPEKSLPERTVSHAEPRCEPALSVHSAREHRPSGSRLSDERKTQADIEIGRLEIEPVEIR